MKLFQRIYLFNYVLLAAILAILGSIIYWVAAWFVELPYANLVLLFAVLPVLFLYVRIRQCASYVDIQLCEKLQEPGAFVVHKKEYPQYQFVDVYRALERVLENHTVVSHIRSAHHETLSEILNSDMYSDDNRNCKTPTALPYPIDLDQEEYLESDGFRIVDIDNNGETSRVVVRLRVTHQPRAELEVAAKEGELASNIITAISDTARRNSIYRGKCIELQFDSNVDSYGDIETQNAFTIQFKSRTEVSEDDIILDPGVQQVIERNVIDFHRRRDRLAEAGLPKKRGLLFYGPPGTGKTFTCKHIACRLPEATVIFAVGSSLLYIKSVCNVARMLQPTVVVLEDVDLVFSRRESNPFVTALGTLLDELDGVSDDDEIIFILTTNAIERLEEAVRDRPGRISQCVPISAPTPPLRERYFRRLLRDYKSEDVDLDELVAKTEGSTQAFIKEFVFRAVQVATENGRSPNGPVALTNKDFNIALEEMTAGAGRHSLSIIGFR